MEQSRVLLWLPALYYCMIIKGKDEYFLWPWSPILPKNSTGHFTIKAFQRQMEAVPAEVMCCRSEITTVYVYFTYCAVHKALSKAWSHNNTSNKKCCYEPWFYQHDIFCAEKTRICAKTATTHIHTQMHKDTNQEAYIQRGQRFCVQCWLHVCRKTLSGTFPVKEKQTQKDYSRLFFPHKAVQISTSFITNYTFKLSEENSEWQLEAERCFLL